MRETPEDLHAVRREQKRRKAKHGMRVAGAGARVLARLLRRPGAPKRPNRLVTRKRKAG